MTRWHFSLVVVGVAVVAGTVGSWTGLLGLQTFAQEARPRAGTTPAESTEADRGWIGLMVENGPGGELLVKDVFPGGPGAFSRIRRGDEILRVGDVKVQTEDELAEAIEQLKPGAEAAVVVRRNKEERSLTVRVGSLHDFHHRYAQEMWHRDPRDPNYANSHGISQADLTIELARRLFEQHERLETSLHELREEVAELRRELKTKDAADR